MKKYASIAVLVAALTSACTLYSKSEIDISKRVAMPSPLSLVKEELGALYTFDPVEYISLIQEKVAKMSKDYSEIRITPKIAEENNMLTGFYVYHPKYGNNTCSIQIYEKLCECIK